jgi:hypothetical protein
LYEQVGGKMRGRSFKLLAIITVYILALPLGCTHATPPHESAEALRTLLDQKSTEAFDRLLKLNGKSLPEGSVAIGYDFSEKQPERVNDVDRITSAGTEYVIVLLRQELDYQPPRPLGAPPRSNPVRSKSQIAYVFNTDGRLLQTFGKPAQSDLLFGDEVQIRTLGSNKYWFALVSHSVQNQEPPRETVIYLLDKSYPKLLTVAHYTNNLAFTGTRESAATGVMLKFDMSNEQSKSDAEGKGRDGQMHSPIIRWDETKREFYGPSQVGIDGKFAFRVDLNESKAFRRTD